MSFANKLRETAHNSVDQEKADKIVKVLLKKAEDAAKAGKFEVTCSVFNEEVGITGGEYLGHYFKWYWHRDTAFGLLIKKKLEANGLRIVERMSLYSVYGVITW